jgi:hypothetical protein
MVIEADGRRVPHVWRSVVRAVVLGWILLALAAAAGPVGASATPALSILNTGERTVAIELVAGANQELEGTRELVVRNESATPGTVHITYLPEHGAASSAITLAEAPATLAPHAAQAVSITAKLPKNADPGNLDGLLEVSLEANQKQVGTPETLTIEGIGGTLHNVTLLPSSLTLHSVNWWGPISTATSATISVEARGAGVPGMFKTADTFVAGTLLRSSTGRELSATLTLHKPEGANALTKGELFVTGKLAPGSYSGTLPLAPLANGGPQLEVKTESGDAFIWALLAVGLGAVMGGCVYLASSLKRRKDLMQGYLKEALVTYRKCLDELEQQQAGGAGNEKPFPMWKIDGLGEPNEWFKRRWTAVPRIDGVQGIWSQIYWARNEEDLDALKDSVNELLGKLERWLEMAKGDGLQTLIEADELNPQNPGELVWKHTKTCFDTDLLLREIREHEPAGDDPSKALNELSDRIAAQARWHSAMANLWNLKAVVLADVTDASKPPNRYSNAEREKLKDINLIELDEQGSPAKAREFGKQDELETKIDVWREGLIDIYKGDKNALKQTRPAGPDSAAQLGVLSKEEVQTAEGAMRLPASIAPAGVIAEHQPAGELTAERSWQARLGGAATQAPGWLRAIIFRDLLWSTVTVVVAMAVYVPVLYGPTWGNLGDYATAFIAGFVGKVAIKWALLPVFRSLNIASKAVPISEIIPS